eukprot:1331782-Pleurochrysis_carterae.AAC.1
MSSASASLSCASFGAYPFRPTMRPCFASSTTGLASGAAASAVFHNPEQVELCSTQHHLHVLRVAPLAAPVPALQERMQIERLETDGVLGKPLVNLGQSATALNEYAACYISCYTRIPCNAKWPH